MIDANILFSHSFKITRAASHVHKLFNNQFYIMLCYFNLDWNLDLNSHLILFFYNIILDFFREIKNGLYLAVLLKKKIEFNDREDNKDL